ncbi:hypothetical protein [Desulfotalea psychrophila]|uniref:hypothetical protein n=1 Tax=Desulfotalea psychrophila TaxID=84980 RepID=UPI00030BD1EF|nr:hypothetical protein [Desulfotalea psychrophila]
MAAFTGMPYFKKPSRQKLEKDVHDSLKLKNISGIGFFGLGWIADEDEENWYLFKEGKVEASDPIIYGDGGPHSG